MAAKYLKVLPIGRNSFWRSGREFTREVKKGSFLTSEELTKEIRDEPLLSVTPISEAKMLEELGVVVEKPEGDPPPGK